MKINLVKTNRSISFFFLPSVLPLPLVLSLIHQARFWAFSQDYCDYNCPLMTKLGSNLSALCLLCFLRWGLSA